MTVGRPRVPLAPGLPEYPTLVHALAFAAEKAPDRVALICRERSLTYAQYLRAVGGLAARLRDLGARGSRVALLLPNSIEMSVACLAGMAAGGQIAPFNAAYKDRELAPLLADAEAAVVICSPDLAARVGALAARLGIPHVLVLGYDEAGGEGEDLVELAQWTDDPGARLPDPLPGPDDPAAMFFTGGTTGVPKGAEHVHSAIIWFCRQTASLWRLDFDSERILSVAPQFHIWGHHFSNVMPLYLRATLVLLPLFQPGAVLKLFGRQRITVFAGGPPTIYLGLLANRGMDRADFSTLKYCLSGGAPCPENLLREWERRAGCPLLEANGMSEGAPITNNPSHGPRKLLSVGVTPPMTEIDIVDLETGTRVLPPGERGEVRVRGPQFSRSYRNRPEETAIAIRDGWLYTGDVGYFDDDGYLFLVDRKKELILVGGYNVYPREVDEVLYDHPAVHEAATVGLPDDFRGEVVKAFVVPKPGAAVSERALIEHCAERLADYKVPVAIEIVEALPKTGPGKIDKLALRGLRD